MLPERINENDFLLIKDELEILNLDLSFKRKSNLLEYNIDNLLEHCYKLDTSENQPSYVLLDRDIILPGYKLELEVSIFNHDLYFGFIILKSI